jgi:hypothetical protein
MIRHPGYFKLLVLVHYLYLILSPIFLVLETLAIGLSADG